jgi:predicted RNA binding protein YcfA (HicA-like mRNA interferase family)
MPKLRRLSGKEVVSIFTEFGFMVVGQRGSHMKLRREVATGSQILTVPAHAQLDAGTLRAIIRQASRFIPEEELKPNFYR